MGSCSGSSAWWCRAMPESNSAPFVRLEAVRKLYRRRDAEFLAVSEVTFDVGFGEMFSLVVPSGCGKTTILKMLAGLYPRDAGRIEIGNSEHRFDPARDIGMVFQQPLLLKWRRILGNVLLPAEILGLPMRESRERARARARPQARADGRAVRRARRDDTREDESRAAGDLAREPQDHRVRHPRDCGSGIPRKSRRGAHRRAGQDGGRYPDRAAASAHARSEDRPPIRRIHPPHLSFAGHGLMTMDLMESVEAWQTPPFPQRGERVLPAHPLVKSSAITAERD